MDERNTNRLTPPVVDQRSEGARLPEPERLSTADLAAAGSATDEAAPAGPRTERPEERHAVQQVEHVEAARTERMPAPETRVEPSTPYGVAAPAAATQDGHEQGHAPPSPQVPAVPMSRTPADASTGAREETHQNEDTPLFAADEGKRYRNRWDEIQAGFVDDPRQAVEQADHMVAEVMKRLAEVFADQRNTLEQQWSKGDDISTEDLRVTLRRYRSFFSRLLSI